MLIQKVRGPGELKYNSLFSPVRLAGTETGFSVHGQLLPEENKDRYKEQEHV
jgi:hypothetical protein